MRYVLAAILALVSLNLKAQEASALQALAGEYGTVLSELSVPILQLGYLDNLNGIRDTDSRAQQQARFSAIHRELEGIDYPALELEDQYLYQHLQYRLALHLRRLDLENRYRELVTGRIEDTTGIYHQPLGREWYAYFLESWLSIQRTPEELFIFGETEVLAALQEISIVQQQAGFDDEDAFYQYLNSDEFMLADEEAVIASYRERATIVQQKLGNYFANAAVPDVGIEPFPESDKDTVPGQLVFTPNPVFRFNFFEQRHNMQDMDFLYLHEVVPGHAFHAQYNQNFPHTPYGLAPIGAYAGFSEGWGAYVEELGEELGLYQTPWLKMGRLKFDLVRSARVVLDVGINYFGWDNASAMTYWLTHIKGQDQIAQREIDRVRRWPGQAISYKVGAAKLLELRAQAQVALGAQFDIKEFHHRVLGFGGVPLFLVERRVREYMALG